MRRYLFDTGVASNFVQRREQVFEKAKSEIANGNRIGICVPVLGELFFGIELSTAKDQNRQRLHRALSTLTIWPFSEVAAAEFGRIAATLKRIGRPMQQIDIQIAAIAMTLGNCTVVTGDSDLCAVPGLSLANWA